MRAVIFEEFGEPAEVLSCKEKEIPKPASGEVRVKMLYSPINPSDMMCIRGGYGIRPDLPATPGFEGVGIVQESGGGLLGKLIQGKRVVVLNDKNGNWSEETVTSAKKAIPIPDDLSYEDAAMFFVNPATAYVLTREVLPLKAGEWLLQTAAGSALGRMVVRLGKLYGFKTLNVVRREEQMEELKDLGADEVVCFDGTGENQSAFLEKVKEIVGQSGVPYAIDPVGGSTGSAISEALGIRGRMVTYGSLSGEPLNISARTLVTNNVSVEGFWLSRYMMQLGLLGKIKLVKKITRLMRDRVLYADAGQIYPLEEIQTAVTEAEKVGRSGKVLLKISQ